MPSVRRPSTPHRQVSPSTAPASTPLLSDPHAPHTPTEHSHTPTTPEPCHVAKVSYYVDYFLSGNRQLAFPGALHMAVLGDLSPDNVAARGNLKSITPEEQRHALMLAISGDIANGQSHAVLRRWRDCVLSTVVTFTPYDTDDDLFWAATNQRESIGACHDIVVIRLSTAGPNPYMSDCSRMYMHALSTPSIVRCHVGSNESSN